jgi:hypothetical protein
MSRADDKPRQSGKTTLARELLTPDSENYFDLERPTSLRRLEDPETSLGELRGLVTSLAGCPPLKSYRGASRTGKLLRQILFETFRGNDDFVQWRCRLRLRETGDPCRKNVRYRKPLHRIQVLYLPVPVEL